MPLFVHRVIALLISLLCSLACNFATSQIYNALLSRSYTRPLLLAQQTFTSAIILPFKEHTAVSQLVSWARQIKARKQSRLIARLWGGLMAEQRLFFYGNFEAAHGCK